MTGRNAWRRGAYTHTPMSLELGRKVMPHLFKRNNYGTYLVGKEQPFSSTLVERKTPGKFFILNFRPWMLVVLVNEVCYFSRAFI